MNQEQRSLLAKLMATEDISVEHKNIATAMFHPTERTLYLPIWEDVTKDVYDLLVGHEVSHALYTSTEDVVDICERIDADNVDTVKDFLNVVEDARIEKKIKRRYNGLRRSFRNGYEELLEKDWFGTEGRLIESYQFIDRINLHFKLGTLMDIPFSNEELPYLSRIADAETFDEVFELTEELYNKAKVEKEKEEEIPTPASGDGDEDGDNEETESDDSDKSEESEESDEYEDDEEFSLEIDSDGSVKIPVVERSETQQEMENALNSLLDGNKSGVEYAKIPSVDADQYIVKIDDWTKPIWQKWNSHKNTLDWVRGKTSDYKKFKTDSTKVVNYLAKEFEMKKNAQQYARALTSRTGVLDVNKIHSYKFNEDLFKKITVIPEGKNHGLLFFVDWSGSMQGSINPTLKQLLNLVWFCRKVNIPFEVFAFTDNSSTFQKEIKYSYKDGDLMLGEIRLVQLVSSTLNTKRFNDACKTLYVLGEAFSEHYWDIDPGMRLSSTPLNEAIVLSHDIIPKFKSNNRLEVVNTVFLTDGMSNGMDYVYDSSSKFGSSPFRTGGTHYNTNEKKWERSESVLTDRVTKYNYPVSQRIDITNALLESVVARHDVNVIGFFVGSNPYDIKSIVQAQFGVYDTNEIMKEFRKEKCLVVEDCKGYTEFYIIAGGKDLDVGEDTLDVADDATKRVLTTAFKKQLKNKVGNRVILNRFIDLIS